MFNSRKLLATLHLFVAITIAALSGCTRPPEQPMKEAPPPAAESAPPSQPAAQPEQQEALPPPPPATMAEARSAVERLYKDAVSLQASLSPGFAVGDFNGDGSQDLAAVVRPAKEKLADINHELASWMVRDPLSDSLPLLMERRKPNEPKPRPVITERDEALLVVIHGYGPAGWRNPQAQQTYLLKSAAGNNIKTESKKSLLKRSQDKRPPLLGDVLAETIAGRQGFIYYTGASYGWYDPLYYQGEIAKRMAH
jgi:hypothetical protein